MLSRVGAGIVALCMTTFACGDDGQRCDPLADNRADAMTVLTYNVAGLPQGLSGSDPEINTPLISPLLNPYDLVLVQEDFVYHEDLMQDACHPYQSEQTPTFGDGLNRFSDYPFDGYEREAWEVCNGLTDSGSDCAAPKGFSVATHTMAPGVEIDVYNLHMDAGRSEEDAAARAAQTEQLLDAVAARSAGRAIIIAGDTNMKAEDEEVLQRLLSGADLEDVCRVLACGEENRIDRIMFRSSSDVILSPSNWHVDRSFVREDGGDLSDHEAVGAEISWSAP